MRLSASPKPRPGVCSRTSAQLQGRGRAQRALVGLRGCRGCIGPGAPGRQRHLEARWWMAEHVTAVYLTGLTVKALVFPVVRYRCELDHKEGWARKNWRFPTVVLEKTLESSLDSKDIKPVNPKGNQSWIFSLEEPMLKLKTQYFGHLMQRLSSLEKTLMLGNIEGRRRSRWQRVRWLNGITDSMDMSLKKPWETESQGSLACCSPQGRRVKHDWTMKYVQNVYAKKHRTLEPKET